MNSRHTASVPMDDEQLYVDWNMLCHTVRRTGHGKQLPGLLQKVATGLSDESVTAALPEQQKSATQGNLKSIAGKREPIGGGLVTLLVLLDHFETAVLVQQNKDKQKHKHKQLKVILSAAADCLVPASVASFETTALQTKYG